MKLAVSNIAWENAHDEQMYSFLKGLGYQGLEIAPTRIFPDNPYQDLTAAKAFADKLYKQYGLKVCSMQSIWYGKQENIFGSIQERQLLIDYTKQSIEFAAAISCPNLVFGCPKNRIIAGSHQYHLALEFFAEVGDYAALHGTTLAIEANPAIYNTNFINTTKEAFSLCREIQSRGIAVNLDCGTMIENKEDVHNIINNIELVNHIHLSEPYLEKLKERQLYTELYRLLKRENYQHYTSIEMKKYNDISVIKGVAEYIREIFV